MKCKFHPLDDAYNHCDYCDSNVCESCSDESATRARSRADRADHNCFVCGGQMQALKGAIRIPPFWSRLTDVYRYPLSLEAIIALLLLSFLSALLSGSLLLLLLPSVAIMMYSFACLRETASGNLDAPGLEVCFEGSVAPLFYMLVIVFFFGAIAYKIFALFGTGVGLLAFSFYFLALPAAVIIIATEEKLLAAINPAELFSVMRATGSSYFVLLLFILIMVSSVFALQSFIGGAADSFFGVMSQSLIANYYGVVIYHLMGYLVYQNQEALGFKTRNKQAQPAFRSETDRVKSHLDVLIKAGDYDAATDLAIKKLRDSNATLWDWSRAFSLMCAAKPNNNAKSLFSDYVNKLEKSGKADQVASAYMQLTKQQPQFEVDDQAQRILVADSLFEIGEYSQVVTLLHKFHQHSSDNALVTRALKLLSESLPLMPGREKLANQYQTLYQLQLKKC